MKAMLSKLRVLLFGERPTNKRWLALRLTILAYAAFSATFLLILAIEVHPVWINDIWGLLITKGALVYFGLVSGVLFTIAAFRVPVRRALTTV